MPRSRLISMFPPGAIRLVPTLITTRIGGWSAHRIHFHSLRKIPVRRTVMTSVVGQHLYPAVRMAFWQGDKSCRAASYACLQRYQPIFPIVSRIMSVSAGISSGSVAKLDTRVRTEPGHVVADIASGTGTWTRMLLENGNKVFGVEPNTEMRQAGGRLLAAFPKFTSVAGTAEATTLPDRSVDFVTVAQAAHCSIASGRDASLCES